MHSANQSELLVRLLLGWGVSGHPHMVGILLNFEHWSLSLWMSIRPPSHGGDTTEFIALVSLFVNVNPATLTWWGYYWIWNIGISLCECQSGHPHMVGILLNLEHWYLSLWMSIRPPSHGGDTTEFWTLIYLFMNVNPATLTWWGYYWIWNIGLSLYECQSGHPHMVGILLNLEHWSLSLWMSIRPPSHGGDTTEFGTLVSLFMNVNPATLTWWGYYWILNIGLSLYECQSGHPHMVGILLNFEHWSISLWMSIRPPSHGGDTTEFGTLVSLFMNVNPATLTWWGYYWILNIGLSLFTDMSSPEEIAIKKSMLFSYVERYV